MKEFICSVTTWKKIWCIYDYAFQHILARHAWCATLQKYCGVWCEASIERQWRDKREVQSCLDKWSLWSLKESHSCRHIQVHSTRITAHIKGHRREYFLAEKQRLRFKQMVILGVLVGDSMSKVREKRSTSKSGFFLMKFER